MNQDRKFDFNDICIVPAIQSEIRSRMEIRTHFIENQIDKSPIIVSPMDTVIDENNFRLFLNHNMMVCFPRGKYNSLTELEKQYVFFSYGLDEFQKLLLENFSFPINTLIDIANGNMNCLPELIKKFKSIYKNHKIMVGNIANPETYRVLSEAGADYIRCGIGAGFGCLSSKMLGIHYPMASLINEIYIIKQKMINEDKLVAEIVADGGFKEYSDIIKGLALGADKIMLGSSLNKCIESCGDSFLFGLKISNKASIKLFNLGFPITKKFRGMSTKEVQRKWNKSSLRSSEGVIRFRKVEYTLDGWYRNFDDYLKSCMSYTGIKTLEDFIGKPEFIQMTDSSYFRYNK